MTGDSSRGVPLGGETVLIQKPFRVSDLERAIERALSATTVSSRRNMTDAALSPLIGPAFDEFLGAPIAAVGQ